jgi:hypothetical protein
MVALYALGKQQIMTLLLLLSSRVGSYTWIPRAVYQTAIAVVYLTGYKK